MDNLCTVITAITLIFQVVTVEKYFTSCKAFIHKSYDLLITL